VQPAVFVAHDMTHVITGYEPTAPGELALGAFQISMNDSQR
jgi:ubiquinone biosynthesis protein Coq4